MLSQSTTATFKGVVVGTSPISFLSEAFYPSTYFYYNSEDPANNEVRQVEYTDVPSDAALRGYKYILPDYYNYGEDICMPMYGLFSPSSGMGLNYGCFSFNHICAIVRVRLEHNGIHSTSLSGNNRFITLYANKVINGEAYYVTSSSPFGWIMADQDTFSTDDFDVNNFNKSIVYDMIDYNSHSEDTQIEGDNYYTFDFPIPVTGDEIKFYIRISDETGSINAFETPIQTLTLYCGQLYEMFVAIGDDINASLVFLKIR